MSCLKRRNRRTVMCGRCQTFRCCGDFLQNWCHAWLFVASVSIWLGLLTSQLRHWTVHLSEMAFLKVKHPNSGHWAVCWVNSRDWKVEGCQRCNLSRLKTGHFPSLHHSQLTLTLTLTRLEACQRCNLSRSTTSQQDCCKILNLKELDIDAMHLLEAGQRCKFNINHQPAVSLHHSQLDIGQCATSWKPVKDATCPHRPPASWSVLLHQCQINSPQTESVN